VTVPEVEIEAVVLLHLLQAIFVKLHANLNENI
jgi:hypothetical protein